MPIYATMTIFHVFVDRSRVNIVLSTYPQESQCIGLQMRDLNNEPILA
jgi:hypothetical protein